MSCFVYCHRGVKKPVHIYNNEAGLENCNNCFSFSDYYKLIISSKADIYP